MPEIPCDNCGELTYKKPCRIERSEYDFCSLECHNQFQKGLRTGEDSPTYTERVTYTCEYCGGENEATPSEAEDRVYCDEDCMAKDFQERYSGQGNPSWNGGKVEVECEWCGSVDEYVPARAEVRRFCSDECYKDWLSEHRQGDAWVGEDNPSWAGGQERNRFYGPNWEHQRQRALERDDHECMLCRSTQHLVVHHKKPMRNFDRDKPRWWERANQLDNLITLCRSCHRTVHANPEDYLFDFIG
ncbi:MAG: HNH endonuclease [Salinivenus sp.]